MSWDRLPLEIYVNIFKNLDFWDRKPLSLVCRRWNEAVFSRPLCKNLCIELSRGDWGADGGADREQVVLVEEDVVEASERDYRVAYVKWCKESNAEVMEALDRRLKELDEKCSLEGLIIDAPLGSMLTKFFRTHADLMARIRKLQVSAEATETTPRYDRVVLKMDELKTLFWREIVSSNQLQSQTAQFVLNAPKLESAVVRFGDSEADHGVSWHSSFLELDRTDSLKALKVHLHTRMWERFFEQQLNDLEHLTLFHRMPNLQVRDWDAMFANMPNLKSIQMWEVNDTVLEAINRHCPLVRVLLLDNVDLTGTFLTQDRSFPRLEHLRLESGKVISNKTLDLPLLKNLEWFNVKNQEGHTLKIVAPILRSLRQSKHGQSDFLLSTGPPLEKLQLDLYAADIPEHFSRPFPTMRELSVRISSARPDMDRVIPHFRNITEFTLISYNAPLQCDLMLGQMFKNCEAVTSLTLCGFNPNLEMAFPVFAQIFRNPNLKSLKLFGLTVTGNSGPIVLPPDLSQFEMRSVKVMDVAFGAYVFPPDGSFRMVCNKTDEYCCYSSKDCE